MDRILILCIIIGYCLTSCASAPAASSSALDVPISFHGQTELKALSIIKNSLTVRDAGEFQMANEVLRHKFEARRAIPLTEVERAKAYQSVVEGMTPRQVILLGMMLYADRVISPVTSTSNQRDERLPREDHIQEHDDGNDTIVIDAIHLYSSTVR